MKSFEGYLKKKLGDSYVLLAGGGHKDLNNFIGTLNYDSDNKKLQYKKIGDSNYTDLITFGSHAFDSTSYLPLAGGSLSGAIKRYYSSSSTDSMIALNANNCDTWLWTIENNGYGPDSWSAGYGLKYVGSNSTPNNYLQLIGGTNSGALYTIFSVNEYGNIGINLNPNDNYKVTINGSINATSFVGNLSGNATTATSAGSATNATYPYIGAASGNVNYALVFTTSEAVGYGELYCDNQWRNSITYNPSTNKFIVNGPAYTGGQHEVVGNLHIGQTVNSWNSYLRLLEYPTIDHSYLGAYFTYDGVNDRVILGTNNSGLASGDTAYIIVSRGSLTVLFFATPTVNGTNVSLEGHNHNSLYVTEVGVSTTYPTKLYYILNGTAHYFIPPFATDSTYSTYAKLLQPVLESQNSVDNIAGYDNLVMSKRIMDGTSNLFTHDSGNNANTILYIPTSSNVWGVQLGFEAHGRPYTRSYEQGSFGNWNTIAYITDIPSSLPANGGTSDYSSYVYVGSASADTDYAMIFTTSTSPNLSALYTDSSWRSGITFNPGTNKLKVGGVEVSLNGHTHDDRYYTESESDGRYLKLSGNTTSTYMTGTIYMYNTSGLYINSPNTDLDIWHVAGNGGSWNSEYGFNLQYLGTGGGNYNDLVLWAHNCTSTHQEVYRVHQDGTLIFGKTPYVGSTAVSLNGHTHNDLYVTSLGTSGDYLTWTKNGNTNNITVPYSTYSSFANTLYIPRLTGSLNTDYADTLLRVNITNSGSQEGSPGYQGWLMDYAWDWDGGYSGQIFLGLLNNGLFYRTQKGGKGNGWNTWAQVSIVGHTHPYLPLYNTSEQVVEFNVGGVDQMLTIKRSDSNYSMIKYQRGSTTCGYLGFTSGDLPTYRTSGGTDYTLYHTGNLPSSFPANGGTATNASYPYIGQASGDVDYAILFTTATAVGYEPIYCDTQFRSSITFNPSNNKLKVNGPAYIGGILDVSGTANIDGSINMGQPVNTFTNYFRLLEYPSITDSYQGAYIAYDGASNVFRMGTNNSGASNGNILFLHVDRGYTTVYFESTPYVGNTAVSLDGHTHSTVYIGDASASTDRPVVLTTATAVGLASLYCSYLWDSGLTFNPSTGVLKCNGTAVSLDGHTHSYLPLSGGTISNAGWGGQLTINRTNGGWGPSLQFSYSGSKIGGIGMGSTYTDLFIGDAAGTSLIAILHASNYTSYCATSSHDHDGRYIKMAGSTFAAPITGPLWVKDTNGLMMHSSNYDLRVWSIEGDGGYNNDTYGFHLLYRGTGSGDDNTLDFYAHNCSSTKLLAYRCTLSGVFTFYKSMYAPNYYTTSDRSKKQNVSLFSEHIRKFQLKDTEKWHYGVVAQEVEEMFRDGEEGNMTVNYNSVLSYYVGQLENKVKMLEEKVRRLESQNK